MESNSDTSSEPDGYVQDGFVVPDEPLDDNSSDEDVIPKKRRIRLKKNDQEDMELLEENLGKTTEKKRKVDVSSSEDSLEPGEIPDIYNESIQLAASIFGTNFAKAKAEENKMDFEPAERKEKYIRSEDDVIRELDIPERLQNVFKGRETPSEQEISQESDWILSKLLERASVANPSLLRQKISQFLYLYRIEKYEIPFIAKYRLHILKPELDCDLWEISVWDKEWSYLWTAKQSMKNLYLNSEKNMRLLASGKSLGHNETILARSCKEIEAGLDFYPTKYIFHLSDLESYFKTYIYYYTAGKQTAKFYNQFQEIRKNKIGNFTDKAGLSPEQFAENLKEGSCLHVPVKPVAKPQDLAFELLSSAFTEELQVINAACNLMKSELAGLPSIRNYIREQYFKYFRICTMPTEKGRTILDVFHPYYRVKNLVEGKAVNTWTAELWAEALKCEEQGLITIEFKLPWENNKDSNDDRVLESVKSFYLTIAEDEVESDWNTFRLQVLKQAVSQIYTETIEIVKKDLNLLAEDWVKSQTQAAFFQLINNGTVKKEIGKVIGFVTDPDTQMYGQTYMAVLNLYGEVLEVANFNTLTLRKTEGLHDSDKARSVKDNFALVRMILQYQPDAMVIAVNSLQAITLRKNIMELVENLQIDSVNEIDTELKIDRSTFLHSIIPVYMSEIQVPKLFASSQRSKRLFPEYKILTRMAISLARMALNPLAETLSLASDPNEMQIKYLSLHPLQSILGEGTFLQGLDIVALDLVAQNGVIINEIIHREQLAILLSYVPGLGPVKAAGLIETLKQKSSGRLLMRAQLVGKRMLDHRVYENASGFIKIPYEERESDPLDSTRIHPESYELAKVIARSVFSDIHIRDESLIQEVMLRPQKMQELDLEKYAEIHKAKSGKDIKHVLESIVAELSAPFYVPDKKYCEVPIDEILYLCTGENRHSLQRGSIIQACVIALDDRNQLLKCRLECGVEATVESKMVPEKKGESEILNKGEVVTARVIEISTKQQNKDIFFRIKLSLLPDDIMNHGKFIHLNLDDAFVMEDADWIEKAVMEDEYKTGQKYVPRVVNHPKFKNIGLRTACEELMNKDIGECIFRPSSRGQDHLTCTWKFYDFIYSHLDIIEEGKPAINMLGTKFRISTDVYESLQEVLDRYIGPCEKLTKEAISHPKFKDSISGGSKFIEGFLTQEKKARPSSIPYYFTIKPEYPQYLVLYYMPREEVTSEFIKVKPRGLFFHEAYHPNINFLISWFKRHFSDRTYKGQLTRSKPPIIDTTNHLSIPGKAPVEEEPAATWGNENFKPISPRHLPDSTPYTTRTPHIGNQEWSGGNNLTKTPRADDWEMARNFDSWGNKTPAAEDNVKSDKNWGETSDWANVPSVPETNWGDSSENNRGRGRGRGRGCHKCGEDGHMARECPNPSTTNDRNCFKCGQSGHMSRECTNPPSGDKNCFKCGQSGHMSRECTNPPSGDRPPRACFKCGDAGHMSRECTNPSSENRPPRACFKCGDTGHMSRECTNPDDSRARRPRGRGRGRRDDDTSAGFNESSNSAWGGDTGTNSAWGGENITESSGWGGTGNNAWGGETKSTETNAWGSDSKPQGNSWGTEEKKSEWGGTVDNSGGGWGGEKKIENNAWGETPKPEEKKNNTNTWGETPKPESNAWGEAPKPEEKKEGNEWGSW